MKVKLITSRAGIGFSQSAGDVVDVPDAEAQRMIAAGQAVAERSSKLERATKTAPAVETAAK